MADEDYGDDAGFFFDDDDYLYVEDEYAIAVSTRLLRCVSGGCSGCYTKGNVVSSDTDRSRRMSWQRTNVPVQVMRASTTSLPWKPSTTTSMSILAS